jgi:hypothetical protein
MKKDEVGGDMRTAHKTLSENLRGKDHFGKSKH